MNIDPNEPINPARYIDRMGVDQFQPTFGLTKREYFAGLFMQSWITHHGARGDYSFSKVRCAVDSIACADALIEELGKVDNE
jgi:hypothetical protein